METNETYYEMLWDCDTCNTKGLLAKSQRHCPMCGNTQDPAKRYFPEVGKEVEVSGHKFVGVDWHCAYCQSANSAAAVHCGNCGAGQDGSKPVSLVAETPPAPPPPPASSGNGKWWLIGIVSVIAILIGLFTHTKETTATIAQRDWQRSIDIERFVDTTDSAWCDSVPAGAYGITHSQMQRSTRKIEAGQSCHDVRTDRGDGTFVKHQECAPKYREEPVYDDRCHYHVRRWKTVRTAEAGAQPGLQSSLNPAWPQSNLANNNGMNAVGAEREGTRHERYSVALTVNGKTSECEVPLPVWQKLKQGQAVPIKVRTLGGVDCGSLQ